MSQPRTLLGQQGTDAVIGEHTDAEIMMNEQPYVIDRAHIDWRLAELQRNRWYKLPK